MYVRRAWGPANEGSFPTEQQPFQIYTSASREGLRSIIVLSLEPVRREGLCCPCVREKPGTWRGRLATRSVVHKAGVSTKHHPVWPHPGSSEEAPSCSGMDRSSHCSADAPPSDGAILSDSCPRNDSPLPVKVGSASQLSPTCRPACPAPPGLGTFGSHPKCGAWVAHSPPWDICKPPGTLSISFSVSVASIPRHIG